MIRRFARPFSHVTNGIEGDFFGGFVGLELDPQVQRTAVGNGEEVRISPAKEVRGQQLSVADAVAAGIVSEVAGGVAGKTEPLDE